MPQPAIAVDHAYRLSLWILTKVESFPRSHRPLVGDRMVSASLELLLLLVRAEFSSAKLPMLDAANLQINSLRFLLRLSKDLKLISLDSYSYAAARCDEVGRMTGGWRKQVAARP